MAYSLVLPSEYFTSAIIFADPAFFPVTMPLFLFTEAILGSVEFQVVSMICNPGFFTFFKSSFFVVLTAMAACCCVTPESMTRIVQVRLQVSHSLLR